MRIKFIVSYSVPLQIKANFLTLPYFVLYFFKRIYFFWINILSFTNTYFYINLLPDFLCCLTCVSFWYFLFSQKKKKTREHCVLWIDFESPPLKYWNLLPTRLVILLFLTQRMSSHHARKHPWPGPLLQFFQKNIKLHINWDVQLLPVYISDLTFSDIYLLEKN